MKSYYYFLLPDWQCNIFTFKTDAPDEGLEPATLRLKVWCSTNWANRALWFHRSQGPTQPRTHQNNLFRQFKVSFCIHFSNIISNIHRMVRLNPKNTRNMPETDPKPSQPLPFICKSTTPSYYHVVTDRSRSVFGAAKPPTYQIEGLDVARPSKTVASANKKRKQAQTARKERRVPTSTPLIIFGYIHGCPPKAERYGGTENMERFTNLRVILAQGPC